MAEAEKNLRVLVIDDNTAIHEDFRKILGASGTEQASLADARSAFQRIGNASDEAQVVFERASSEIRKIGRR